MEITSEKIKIVVNVCIKNICKEQAKKKLALTEAEAADFGCFDETALEEQEKDKFYEDFVIKTFTRKEPEDEYAN